MKKISNKDLYRVVKLIVENNLQPNNVSSTVLATVSGSYSTDDCDELHAFEGTNGKPIGQMNTKVKQKIDELVRQGYKVKVTDVTTDVYPPKVAGEKYRMDWEVEISNSDDGLNWVGFTSRGAGCNNNIFKRYSDESVGNGPNAIKRSIESYYKKKVTQIKPISTYTADKLGKFSFKQTFYIYTFDGSGQSQRNQQYNVNNQQTNSQSYGIPKELVNKEGVKNFQIWLDTYYPKWFKGGKLGNSKNLGNFGKYTAAAWTTYGKKFLGK